MSLPVTDTSATTAGVRAHRHADHRQRVRRPRRGDQADPGRQDRLPRARTRQRRRRYLARQHLPGCGVRRALAPVLLLVRTEPGVDAVVLDAARDPEVHPVGGRQVQGARQAPLRLRRAVRPLERRRPHAGRSPPRRANFVAKVLVSAVGALCEPSLPDIKGIERLRGRDLPLRPLEPRRRPDGQARRGHRHRRLGDPDRARHRQEGVATSTSTSAPRRGCCPARTARTPQLEHARVQVPPRLPEAVPRRHLLDARDARSSAWRRPRS